MSYLNLLNNSRRELFSKSIDIFTSFLICLLTSYAICLKLKLNIFYHTDTFAPIQQLLTLVNFDSIELKDLHLARIPSLLPDLTIIFLIIKIFGQQDLFYIQSWYSFLSILLFLFSTILVLYFLYKSIFRLTLSTLIVSIPILSLIQFSTIYRESFGYLLTPIHQGGNILMTFIFLNLLLIVKQCSSINFLLQRILYLLITIFAGLAIISNKLFIFTSIFPLFCILFLEKNLQLRNSKASNLFYKNLFLLFLFAISFILFGIGYLGINYTQYYSFSWFVSNLFQVVGFLLISASIISFFISDYDHLWNQNNNISFRKTYHFFLLILRDFLLRIKYNSLFRFSIFILLPVFFGIISIFFYLNTQCIYPISIDVSNTYSGFLNLLSNSKILLFTFIVYLFILISFICTKFVNFSLFNIPFFRYHMQFFYTNFTDDSTDKLSLPSFILLFIAFSSLTPLIYLWPAEGIYIRYLLITLLFFPLLISIFISFLFISLRLRFLNSFEILKTSFLFVYTLLLVYNFNYNNIISSNYSFSKWPIIQTIEASNSLTNSISFNLTKSFKRSAILAKSDYALDHEQIKYLGLTNGLSDYWGSSVSEIGYSNMKVSPILPNGSPNYWAHSKLNFIDPLTNEFIKFLFCLF